MRNRRLALVGAIAALAPFAASAHAAKSGHTPTFRQYESPVGAKGQVGLPSTGLPHTGNFSQSGIGDHCGEPTLGVDRKTGAVLFQCGLQTLRVTGFDKSGRGSSTWTDVTGLLEGYQTSDPILYTDPTTNRTYVNQLELQGCSLQAFTDDDGASWKPSATGCGPGIAFDHQTVGSGKPAKGSTLAPVGYPNLLYYCTNDIEFTDCAVSVDGGESFLPATPVDTDARCQTITGHVKSAPDGTVYLMPSGCGHGQGVYVSGDNTLSWTLREIPGATQGNAGDGSIAVGKDGTLYAAYGSNDAGPASQGGGRVHVVVSRNKGAKWGRDVALGKDVGVVQTRFPVAVAGDGDRAAIAYLGTKTRGNSNNPKFRGVWRLYLSYTFDRGAHWTTYDATPGSPVQVGEICTLGTVGCLDADTQTSPDRNLLDFIDMVVDPRGYPAVAIADGCLKSTTCSVKDRLEKGAIIRQVGGRSLFHRFD
ncbi:MAG: hypothetical protein QOJ03_1522 [Frankiaceae bacterium]|jgi:hypothetical protein|nr:hypothetical protein [Frankiaceae bacterium]